jgi:hypothetical protein
MIKFLDWEGSWGMYLLRPWKGGGVYYQNAERRRNTSTHTRRELHGLGRGIGELRAP